MQPFKVSSWTAPSPQACIRPLLQHDNLGSTVATSPSTGPHPGFQLYSPVSLRARSSPVSVNQCPVFLSSLPAGVFTFPAVPSAQNAPAPAPATSYQLADPKARTL